MRKLLLASAAMLSATMGLAGVASAQGTPWATVNTAPSGSVTPLPVLGSAGAPGTAIPGFGPPLSPGEVTVRLGGRLVAYGGVGADSGQHPGYLSATSAQIAHGTYNATTNPLGATAANTKLASYGIGEYARLYPSIDGLAANGLKYGAFLEIRADSGVAPGGGLNGSVSGATATRGDLYYRRETAYLGTDNLGFLRIGATDQPTSLFITGTFENFDDAGWNAQIAGGNASFPTTTGSLPVYPFPDVGALYTTNKIVYLSPKFADLVDFGVSFAPDSGNTNPTIGACTYANTATAVGCDTTSSTSVSGENKRTRNTVDGVVRLRTATGPVGIAATAGGIYSGVVAYNGTSANTVVPQYNGLAVFDGGLQVTYGGFAIGGHIDYGEFNTSWTPQPKGGRDALAWIVGTSYQFGSAVVGISYFNVQNPGSWSTVTSGAVGRTFNQSGLAAGGTLTLAPGLYTFLSYLYGDKHQAGVDLLTGVAGSAAAPIVTHNNVQAQSLVLGTRVAW